MVGTDNKYFCCPVCGMMMKFIYDIYKGVYISKCPYCGNLLEIDKNEYEEDKLEIYFEPDQGII